MFMDGKTQLYTDTFFPNCSFLPKLIYKLNMITIKITMELSVYDICQANAEVYEEEKKTRNSHKISKNQG